MKIKKGRNRTLLLLFAKKTHTHTHRNTKPITSTTYTSLCLTKQVEILSSNYTE